MQYKALKFLEHDFYRRQCVIMVEIFSRLFMYG